MPRSVVSALIWEVSATVSVAVGMSNLILAGMLPGRFAGRPVIGELKRLAADEAVVLIADHGAKGRMQRRR